jgi:GTP-binding protein HflX
VNLPFLLADTVGFIRKLPHDLVESFKSTLDEVREADILVHVVDISHSGFEKQIEVVHDTLHELNALNKPVILVFNKIDKLRQQLQHEDNDVPENNGQPDMETMRKTWMAKTEQHTVFISARSKENFEPFKKLLYKEVKKIHTTHYPYDDFLF